MHQLLQIRTKIGLVAALLLAFPLVPGALGFDPSLSFSIKVAVAEALMIYLGARSWRWLCHLPPAFRPKWMINLNGKWRGTIQSEWKAKPEDPPLAPIPVEVTVLQDWMRISVAMRTEKMNSRSTGVFVEFNRDHDELVVRYFYATDPKAEFRLINPPQIGCAVATVSASNPKVMQVRYTNDRGLGGDITLKR